MTRALEASPRAVFGMGIAGRVGYYAGRCSVSLEVIFVFLVALASATRHGPHVNLPGLP